MVNQTAEDLPKLDPLVVLGGQLTHRKLERVSSPPWPQRSQIPRGKSWDRPVAHGPVASVVRPLRRGPGTRPVDLGLAWCRLWSDAVHQERELGQGLSIGWFPCQGSRRISGGTPPHPDLTRQVHLCCDPHCSLPSSQGRCGHSLSSLSPNPTLFSFLAWRRRAVVWPWLLGHWPGQAASSERCSSAPSSSFCLTQNQSL